MLFASQTAFLFLNSILFSKKSISFLTLRHNYSFLIASNALSLIARWKGNILQEGLQALPLPMLPMPATAVSLI